MKQIVRVACCLLALVFCLPSLAQNADDKQRADGVITIEEMKERLATAEDDGSVITTDKMKERLESADPAGGVITNSTLSTDEAAAAARAGAFTNADLGSTGESEEAESEATESTEEAEETGPSVETPAEPDAERERLIGEIESELDALAERVRNLEGETDDARLQNTESKIEELRRAVEALKQGE